MTQPLQNLLDETVKSELSFLHQLNYCYCGVTLEESSSMGPYLVAHYENRQISRAIEIWYMPSGKVPHATCCTFVSNDNNSTFEINSYLEHTKAAPNRLVNCHITDGNAKSLAAYFNQVASVLDTELAEVVRGKKWEAVPIDWGDYK